MCYIFMLEVLICFMVKANSNGNRKGGQMPFAYFFFNIYPALLY